MPELPNMKNECLTCGDAQPPSLCLVLQKALDGSWLRLYLYWDSLLLREGLPFHVQKIPSCFFWEQHPRDLLRCNALRYLLSE